MTFLGLPCPCGWALDDINETVRSCERCNRRYKLKEPNYWVQTTDKNDIKFIKACGHNRIIGEKCPHCKGGVASEWLP